jgi:hypothetical protein
MPRPVGSVFAPRSSLRIYMSVLSSITINGYGRTIRKRFQERYSFVPLRPDAL